MAAQCREQAVCTCPVACAAAGALRPPARRWARWMNDRTVLRSLVKWDRTTSSVQPHCTAPHDSNEHASQTAASLRTDLHMQHDNIARDAKHWYAAQEPLSDTKHNKPHPLRQHAGFVLAEAVLQREERQQHLLSGRRQLRLGCW